MPNRGVLNIIKSINLNQLQLLFTDSTAYNPSTSSNSTDAAFTLPFDFPIDISALEQTLAIGFDGTTFAQLSLPKAPTSTNVMTRVIHLTFDNVPFAVFGDKHPIFNQFVAATTVGNTQTLHLSGSANADAKTAVGILSLMGINFSIDSSINGLQGLNTKPVTVSSLDVNHGFPDFLLIKVDTSLFNPRLELSLSSLLSVAHIFLLAILLLVSIIISFFQEPINLHPYVGTGDVSFSLEFQ